MKILLSTDWIKTATKCFDSIKWQEMEIQRDVQSPEMLRNKYGT